MQRELRLRLTLGPMLALALVGAVAWDLHQGAHHGIALAAALAGALGAREYVRLARSVAPDVRLTPVLALTLALVAEAWIRANGWLAAGQGAPGLRALERAPTAALLIGLGVGWTLLEQLRRRGIEGCFAHVGASLFGMCYLGLPLGLLIRLADSPVPGAYFGLPGGEVDRGAALLLVFLGAVKLGDVTAFAGGKLLSPAFPAKLCPGISPGKTRIGFACSFVGSIGGALLFDQLAQWLTGSRAFAAWWQPVLWGLVLGPLGVVGDLAESAMKRAAGVKDSGRSVPGFGGVLDLFDALVIAAPAAYALSLVL